MKSTMIAAALAMLASQAHALSCLRPDPIETFQRLAAAEESYFVLHGMLTFDQTALPDGVGDNDRPVPEPIAGNFAGLGLTKEGFTSPYQSAVNLQIGCAGPWCGSAQSGVDAVYFVPAGDPPVTMLAGPCGGMIFYEPSGAVLDMLESCMKGDACTPLPFE